MSPPKDDVPDTSYCAPTTPSAQQDDNHKSTMMTLASIPVPQLYNNDKEPHSAVVREAAVEWASTGNEKHKETIGPHNKTTIIGTFELSHCPCCRRPQQEHRSGNDSNTEQLHLPTKETIACTATSLMDQCVLEDAASDNDEDKEEELLGLEHAEMDNSFRLKPGMLDNGVSYTPTQILVQGWLHKKGTGQDWCKSRAWKARWGRLVWAKVEGYGAIEVPLLLMYWYPSSKTASTAIVLSRSTVVVAVDYAKDPTAWNANRFEIRDVSGDTAPRTFSAANRVERDAWVYAMAQALLDYAKSKQVHDRAATVRVRAVSPPRDTTAVYAARPVSPPPPQRPRSPVPMNLPKSPRSNGSSRKVLVDY